MFETLRKPTDKNAYAVITETKVTEGITRTIDTATTEGAAATQAIA